MVILRSPLLIENQELSKILIFKPRAGQSTALHVYLTNSYSLSIHSTFFFFKIISPLFTSVRCGQDNFLRGQNEVTLLIVKSDWCRLPYWEPVECRLTVSKTCDIVYHKSESDIYLLFEKMCFDLVFFKQAFLNRSTFHRLASKCLSSVGNKEM